MNEDVIRKIAATIYSETILENWRFYTLIVFITFISGYCGNFLSAYSRKRGEQLATKADLNDIKLQLKATTEITEQIRNDFAHEAWRKQQYETIKRQKLEEYLNLIYITNVSLSNEMRNAFFYCEDTVDEHAESKATMLMKLYFMELKDEHNIFLQTYAAFKRWIAEGQQELVEKLKQGELKPTVNDEHMKKYSVLLTALNKSTYLIEEKASQVAEKLISS